MSIRVNAVLASLRHCDAICANEEGHARRPGCQKVHALVGWAYCRLFQMLVGGVVLLHFLQDCEIERT